MRFFHDYGINLVQISEMSDEEIMSRFQSDFHVVAYHFKHWKEPGYKPLDLDMVHVDAVLKMISVMSGDDAYEKMVVTGRRPRKLNEYVEKMREKEQAIGLAKGLLILGNDEEVVLTSLMKVFNLTEADAKSYIAMAEEEMKGVTA